MVWISTNKWKWLTACIHLIYSPLWDGLGVLVVKNVPKFKEYREALLPLARKFAVLPEDTKSKYLDAKSHYSFGWSHGKEKFAGKLDTSKGSYYNNPQYDEVTKDDDVKNKNP
jgi:isopenicillin N synthase-like dioxygenase